MHPTVRPSRAVPCRRRGAIPDDGRRRAGHRRNHQPASAWGPTITDMVPSARRPRAGCLEPAVMARRSYGWLRTRRRACSRAHHRLRIRAQLLPSYAIDAHACRFLVSLSGRSGKGHERAFRSPGGHEEPCNPRRLAGGGRQSPKSDCPRAFPPNLCGPCTVRPDRVGPASGSRTRSVGGQTGCRGSICPVSVIPASTRRAITVGASQCPGDRRRTILSARLSGLSPSRGKAEPNPAPTPAVVPPRQAMSRQENAGQWHVPRHPTSGSC